MASNPKPLTPPQKQLDFIEWLVTPKPLRKPRSQPAWAAEHGLAVGTVYKWRQDPDFKRAWDRRMRELDINPETVGEVLKSMHTKAVEGHDVQAAKLWLEVAGVYTKKTEVTVDDKRDLKDLSDQELDELLASEATDELQARRALHEATPE